MAQLGLVIHDCQYVVAVLRVDPRGNLLLTSHRVDGHDAVRYLRELKQGRNGGDLVRLPVHLYWAEDESIG